jgi:hypothetical protein
MVRYQTIAAPPTPLRPPAAWPAAVPISLDARRLTLVMALHPQCPCSRASVRELAALMARSGDRVSAMVLTVRPAGAPPDWTDTDLRRDAAAIPGVHVVDDVDGKASIAFGATTSGQTALYDPHGRLRFTGGITDGRGHEGDNAGLDAILALVRGGEARSSSTPVYGCPLHGHGVGCETPATTNPTRTP